MPSQNKPTRRTRKSRNPRSGLNYQTLEPRQMLAADFSAQVLSQSNVVSNDNVWRQLDLDDVDTTRFLNVDATSLSLTDLNETGLQRILATAPQEFTNDFVENAARVSIPTPDGGFQDFAIVQTQVMAPELAAEFPDIKTYRGWAVGDYTTTIRLDVTYQGFHAQVLSSEGRYYVEPFYKFDSTVYASVDRNDVGEGGLSTLSDPIVDDNGTVIGYHEMSNGTTTTYRINEDGSLSVDPSLEGHTHGHEHGHDHDHDHDHDHEQSRTPTDLDGDDDPLLAAGYNGVLRTYDFAVAATGEFTQWHGGTVAQAQSAIVTMVNRVTGIYETDTAVRLVLVGNNSSIIYTNPNTDPYSTNVGSMLNQNQSTLDSVIGSNNYDVGHVVTRQSNNGVAILGVVGDNGDKAKGVSATNPPTGDLLAVDYVAHELGHQFAAEHTWANCGGSNGGGSAYEPFSASTIMGYAGICGGGFNLQNNSDAMFNWSSITEIRGEVTTGNANNAATQTNTGNSDPSVNAGANFTIPEGTPFELTAAGSDPDGDTITYSWEQADLNNPSPFLRVWLPTEDPTRVIPRMQDLLNNTTVLGESLPTTSMNIDFRVVARDNSPLSAGHDHDTMRVTVASNNQAFSVTSQNSGPTWDGNSTETITWNVAGTTANGINTANVDIFFALDGFDYDILLASGVPNDGSHDITVPNIATTTGRVKVKGAGNIFFDINNANITIDPTVVSGGGQVGETGMVTGLTHVTQTINFANVYDDPVVVTGPTTYNGIDPLTVRVDNVTQTSFDVYVLEWDYLNGVHNAAEDFAFMVVEAGTHTLLDGTVLQAGHTITDENFTTVNFDTNFASTPVVFSQTTTLNGADAVGNRIQNVSTSSFEVRLQEEEAANQIHADETVDWIAIDQGIGANGGLDFVAGTANNVTDADYTLNYGATFASQPALLASMQTFNGADLAIVRSKEINNSNAVIFLEEEQSADTETSHGNETVGFLAFDVGTILTAQGPGEAGIVTGVTHEWVTVNMLQTYTNPVVVMGPATRNGGDPLTLRVRNVTADSFEVKVNEWDYLNGIHNSGEDLSYVVMEAGTHTLADGTIIEAGNATVDENFTTVSLSAGFGSAPVVLSQTSSFVGPNAVVTRTRNVSTTSFDVRLQEEQAANQIHADETVSWIAIEAATGVNGNYSYESGNTGSVVTHNDFTLNYNQTFLASPVFLANTQTFAGADVVNVRGRTFSSNSVTFFLEEEQSGDNETDHNSAEDVGFWAMTTGIIE